jgi:hypothetical protein
VICDLLALRAGEGWIFTQEDQQHDERLEAPLVLHPGNQYTTQTISLSRSSDVVVANRVESYFTPALIICQTPRPYTSATFSYPQVSQSCGLLSDGDVPTDALCLLCCLVAVRENREGDMRFTFEVISPGQRVYTLQVPPPAPAPAPAALHVAYEQCDRCSFCFCP